MAHNMYDNYLLYSSTTSALHYCLVLIVAFASGGCQCFCVDLERNIRELRACDFVNYGAMYNK